MIGLIIIGKSFARCITYCLEDKKQKQEQVVVFQNRAEILFGNLCSGSKQELVEQFNDIRRLNPRLAKPVMHIMLSGSPEDKISRGTFIQMIQEMAVEMGFERHQYLAVSHSNTPNQHVHIVVNRVGLDGKTLKDSHNYRKIASFCRKMEGKHNLRPVLSPKGFLPKELRLMPRQDRRKDALRKGIAQSLSSCKTWEDFMEKMKALGYQAIKGRGIYFIDAKGVWVKGSEVEYSYRTIERILDQNNGLKRPQLTLKVDRVDTPVSPLIPKSSERESAQKELKVPGKERHLEKALEKLMRSKEDMPAGVNPELLKKAKKKRRSLHL